MKRKLVAAALAVAVLPASLPAQQSPDASEYTFRANSELVLVNITVRDSRGNFVRGLKQSDFTVFEDGKPQSIASFDVEDTEAVTQPVEQAATLLQSPGKGSPAAPPKPAPSALRDHRLLIFFFDLTAMQPEEIDRSVRAAEDYFDRQMRPAELVAIASLATSLQVNQDFTSDRAMLKKAVEALNPGSGQGFEEGSTGTTEGTPDTGQAFTPDETEYNIFNTDRRLEALRAIAAQLQRIEQKKSLIYFSGGMDRTGVENESELRAAVNAAGRANLSIYTMDMRGLQALVAGGEAQNASLRGVAPYSGAATLNALNSNFSSQETLSTLAADTGGRAFLDSNDFSGGLRQVQEDTQTYYVLGYRSSNPARDGRYRRITVRLAQPGLKIVYRRGYYAPADFQHSNKEDRERQLEEALASDLPLADLPVYFASAYFRISSGRFFVPVSIAVPGWEIPFTRGGSQDRATLDIIGSVEDDEHRPAGAVRDTVKLSLADTQQVRRKNVQYNTSFTLPPGKYHAKFVVRENQTGRMGTFETDLEVPDYKRAPVKVSSIVLTSQTQPAKSKAASPLVHDGVELIPSVTHVFSTGQHLRFYYEVYDPQAGAKGAVRLLSNTAFFAGKKKVLETPLLETRSITAPDRHASVFQIDVPLSQLSPGYYTCQVNVIDDNAGRFVFPRVALLLVP